MQSQASPSPFEIASQLLHAGRHGEAERLCRQILAANPRDADTLHLLGVIAGQTGHPDHFLTLMDLAIAQRPDFAAAHSNRGIALMALGRGAEGVAALRHAVTLRPGHVADWSFLGNALAATGDLPGAVGAYRRALALDADYQLARANLAMALQRLGQLDEAIEHFEKVAVAQSDFAVAQYQLGMALHVSGWVEAAVVRYRRALELQPDYVLAHGNLLLALNCVPGLSGPELVEVHKEFDARHAKALSLAPASPAHANDRDPERRLRIGYVSGDLRGHPVGYYVGGPLKAHDRAAFEVYAYSNSALEDEVTEALRASTDHWRSIAGAPDADVAQMIRRDGIDILVDLSGHTDRNRLLLFALKPAPVQASWLGYPGSTGLSAIDYAIMDPSVAPPDADAWFSESVVRLPHGRFCYAPPAYAPEPEVSARTDGDVIFGSFNNLTKIGPDVVALWARVLDAVPGSRLVLKWPELDQPRIRQRVADAFAAVGVGEDRLALRTATPHAQMLAEYADIDIALDPFPFSGGLTSSEALWMGVAVVTLPLDRVASRQTLAFLHELGLDDLAATSPDDYVRIAAALAADPARRAELRRTLRPRMAASPLTDAGAFTPGLEMAYRQMWRRWCEGRSPQAITIA